MRIYLSGRMTIEVDGQLLGPDRFPGRQGRAAFAFLVGQRRTPVSRSALANALWPAELPPSWSTALSSVVSKLRSLFGEAGLDGTTAVRADGGCYELHLPHGCWVDHEEAADRIHEAESALRSGDPAAAYGPSAIARQIARRPFLPGFDGDWFEHRRGKLASILVRALECRAEVYLANGEIPLAVEAARDLVVLRPFRESGYRMLMRAHAEAGNGAEAMRVYERCRTLLSDELGISPSPETKALHSRVLESL